MNLDELVAFISEGKPRDELLGLVKQWKKDDRDVEDLYYLIVKWHGNVWLEDQDNQNDFHSRLEAFKAQAIDGLNGMSVNERLYWFSLFQEWDSANPSDEERIRNKLHAPE